MSFSIDVNLLLFTIDSKSPYHKQAEGFLKEMLSGEERCFICWEVLHGFMRISTNSRLFTHPPAVETVLDNCRFLYNHPNIEMIGASSSSMRILEDLVTRHHLRGPIISDAVIASILEANGIRKLYTHDRDFWKFPYLKPIDPFAKRKTEK